MPTMLDLPNGWKQSNNSTLPKWTVFEEIQRMFVPLCKDLSGIGIGNNDYDL